MIYHIDSVDGAQLERLLLGIKYYVDHCAKFGRKDVIRRVESDSFLEPLLESILRSRRTKEG